MLLVIFLFSVSTEIFSQPISNYNRIISLLDSTISDVINSSNNKAGVFRFHSFAENAVFQGRVNHIAEKALKNTRDIDDKKDTLNLYLENIIIDYAEPYRESFLGDYLSCRKITLTGFYNYTKNEAGDVFFVSVSDPIAYSDISEVEKPDYPFTSGKKPGEPFWDSFWETAIIVTTAAASLALFFTVRSR